MSSRMSGHAPSLGEVLSVKEEEDRAMNMIFLLCQLKRLA